MRVPSGEMPIKRTLGMWPSTKVVEGVQHHENRITGFPAAEDAGTAKARRGLVLTSVTEARHQAAESISAPA
jgi:hypothetical protein